jgi:hypothetical protein
VIDGPDTIAGMQLQQSAPDVDDRKDTPKADENVPRAGAQ